jgi:hypothetical protein
MSLPVFCLSRSFSFLLSLSLSLSLSLFFFISTRFDKFSWVCEFDANNQAVPYDGFVTKLSVLLPSCSFLPVFLFSIFVYFDLYLYFLSFGGLNFSSLQTWASK